MKERLDYYQEKLKARIAIKVAEAMAQEGYDKYTLASELGIPSAMVEGICNADVNISVDLLSKIAFVLNRTIDFNFLCNPLD